MAVFPYLHARVELCSAPMVEQGLQVVRYRGDMFAIVGLYLAQSPGTFGDGKRKLYCILKPFSFDASRGAKTSEGAP